MAAEPSEQRQDRRIVEHSIKAAEAFVSAYYAASDSPQRVQLVPTLYLPNSSIVWNGTPVSGQAQLAAMLNSMPGSKHEVQTFDCHALGGQIQNSQYSPPIHFPTHIPSRASSCHSTLFGSLSLFHCPTARRLSLCVSPSPSVRVFEARKQA